MRKIDGTRLPIIFADAEAAVWVQSVAPSEPLEAAYGR